MDIVWTEMRFPVSDGHELQVYETGASDGVPVIYLHGGPGSGFNKKNADLFDLKQVRLIAFDQRGCGQSTPQGFEGLANNTTAHLIADIEALRKSRGLGQVVLYGSSWGSTLAVEYAKAYTQNVCLLLLASTFVARREDQEWSFEGVKTFYPDAYAQLVEGLPKGVKPQDYLYAGIMSENADRQFDAAFRFDRFGATICQLEPEVVAEADITPASINRARLLLHYAANDFYLPDAAKGVLTGIENLRDVPVGMIHGRYDMDCRPEAAALLASNLPQVGLRFVTGGHSTSDMPYRAEIRAMIAAKLAEIQPISAKKAASK